MNLGDPPADASSGDTVDPTAEAAGSVEAGRDVHTSPAATPKAGPSVSKMVWWGLAVIVALIGLAAQIRVWSADRGLWGDELYIAHNIHGLDFRGLAGVLWYDQLAPTGWLWVEKAMFLAFGSSEPVLRFPSLIAGAAILLLGGLITVRAVGRWSALAAMALVAASPRVLEYSGEFKQYAFEAAAALVVIIAVDLGVRATDASRSRRRLLVLVTALGLFSAAVSYSAIIVLTGATAGAACWLLARRRVRDALVVVGAITPGLLLSAMIILNRLAHPLLPDQDIHFPNGLPPEGAELPEVVAWLPTMWTGFVANPVQWEYPLLVLVLVVGGLAAMAARGRAHWAATLGGVFLAAVAVAAVDAYPFEDRVALYLVAPTIIAVVAAADGTVRLLLLSIRRARSGGLTLRTSAGVLAAGVLVLGALSAVSLSAKPGVDAGVAYAREPLYRDPFRAVMADMAGQQRPGDIVLLYNFSSSQGQWYSRVFDVPLAGRVFMTSADECEPERAEEALSGAHRVWYLKGASFTKHPPDYHLRVAAFLQARGTFVAAKNFAGYDSTVAGAPNGHPGWELFDLDAGPDPSPLQLPVNPAYACFHLEEARPL